MFNKEKFNDAVSQYKRDFLSMEWRNESYKWEAVKCFQDNWDINAPDFKDMLIKSLKKTANLLSSKQKYPKKAIISLAQRAEEETRAMFADLFQEKNDVLERIEAFKKQADALQEKYVTSLEQHYQNDNAISTYLWLRYPEKYYVYKFKEVKAVAKKLESDYTFQKGHTTDNLVNSRKLYDEIHDLLKDDTELIQLVKSKLTDDCYQDPELRLLTTDIGFYISRYYAEENPSSEAEEEWFPSSYNPGLSVDDWLALIHDPEVFRPDSLEIMKRMKDIGGKATCTQLSLEYGKDFGFYNLGSTNLAKRIVKKTGCPVLQERTENSQWWPILYVGHSAEKDTPGSYVWKLRDELSAALDQADLSDVELYAKEDPIEENRRYWWLNIDSKAYNLFNGGNIDLNHISQSLTDVRPGDIIVLCESNPAKQIKGIASIFTEHGEYKPFLKVVKKLDTPIDCMTLGENTELDYKDYFNKQPGNLFCIGKEEYNGIMDMIEKEASDTYKESAPSYTKADFLNEVYMTESRYDSLVGVLRNKKNIILQGAPGVGKTFAAKRLAYSMMGEKDDNHIEFIQFHQNYSYEDFMMGFKPSKDGFEMTYGVFYRFCRKAMDCPEKEFFFIIDEINRGNMSKIFGELLLLIEKDYRGEQITLPYCTTPFSVPKNLYIIGMMNTADRSLAMIDYALRRRFSFFQIEPAFDSEGFIRYQNSLNNETLNELISRIKELNREISLDRSLGKGFCIGHSYFCDLNECNDDQLHAIVEYDILPMLNEYWFDEPDKVQKWENNLLGIFQ